MADMYLDLKVGDEISYGNISGTVIETGPNPKRVSKEIQTPGAVIRSGEKDRWYSFIDILREKQKED